jgi:hypothetical protein
MQVGRILHGEDAIDTGELRRLSGDPGGIHRAHRDSDLGASDAKGAGDALGGAHVELRAVVLRNDQDL